MVSVGRWFFVFEEEFMVEKNFDVLNKVIVKGVRFMCLFVSVLVFFFL